MGERHLDTVAQALRIATAKVNQVAGLQCQRITRPLTAEYLKVCRSMFPATGYKAV